MTRDSLSSHMKHVLGRICYGDVYASAGETVSVDFEMDRLKSIESKEHAALGVRVFEEAESGSHRVGQGFANHEDDLDLMIHKAQEQAQWGETIWFELPRAVSVSPLDTCRDVALSPEEAISWGEHLVAELKRIHKKNKVFVSVNTSDATQWVANTNGFWGDYREKAFSLSCGFSHVDSEGELLYLGDGEGRFDTHFDFQRYVQKMQRLFDWSQAKSTIQSGYYPVIFAPEALDTVLDPLLIALNGSSRHKKICRWENMDGQKVTDAIFSMYDDPFCLEVGDVYPFDDEGMIPTVLPLIQDGVLQNFIYDLATAKRLNTRSTGHGRRSPSSLPSPGFSNLVVTPGDKRFDEMIASLDRGLLVYGTLGGGMSNVVAGDFSVNVELGFVIEHGKVKGRVKDTMIRGNAFDLMQKILFLGSEAEITHGMKVPAMAFENVSVTGIDE